MLGLCKLCQEKTVYVDVVSLTCLVARQIIGFLTSDFILALQWDHIYTANYFLALMGLLAASLAACTSTRCPLKGKCRPPA